MLDELMPMETHSPGGRVFSAKTRAFSGKPGQTSTLSVPCTVLSILCGLPDFILAASL